MWACLTPGEKMSVVGFSSRILTIMLLGSVTSLAQVGTVRLSGRTVDEVGRPVQDAIVTLYYPPCQTCTDHLVPVAFPFPDGVFFIEHTGKSRRGLELFAAEKVPSGFWSPLHGPPFEDLAHLPQFRGIPIRPSGRAARQDLGDVLVKIRYGKAIVDLTSILGERYKPNEVAAKLLRFVLRDQRRKIIYDGWLPERAFDPTFSSVRLALTKGTWGLEFSFADDKNLVRSPQLNIHVTDDGCQRVTMIVGRPTQQPCELDQR